MMSAAKQSDQALPRSTTATSGTTPIESSRKPWKKKSPVEVFVGQIDRLRAEVAEKEEELKQAKRQLQKLEEARKILESS
jgi:hypothetical protein